MVGAKSILSALLDLLSCEDPWSPHHQRNPDRLLVDGLFANAEPVLTREPTVVGGDQEIGVLERITLRNSSTRLAIISRTGRSDRSRLRWFSST